MGSLRGKQDLHPRRVRDLLSTSRMSLPETWVGGRLSMRWQHFESCIPSSTYQLTPRAIATGPFVALSTAALHHLYASRICPQFQDPTFEGMEFLIEQQIIRTQASPDLSRIGGYHEFVVMDRHDFSAPCAPPRLRERRY